MSNFRSIFVMGAFAILSFPSNGQSNADEKIYGIERGTGEVRCISKPASAQIDPSYARAAAWDRMMFGEGESPCGIELEEFDPGTWSRTQPLPGVDSGGRSSDFRIYVLDARFAWTFGSSEQIEREGDIAQFGDIFSRPLFLNELCSADAALGFGAASFEGDEAINRQIAGRRGRTIASQLSQVGTLCETTSGPPLYSVNLGEHIETLDCGNSAECRAQTSGQRRLVFLIAI